MPTLVQDILRVGDGDRSYQSKKPQNGFEQEALAQLNERCVHELFESEVDQNPETVALVCGDQQLTYRELNERANQLAHFLIRFGVGPNSLVGLCLRRTPEMIIGILGILKAGGAYVPMDPTSSTQRLGYMIEDANIFVLLTQSALLKKLPRHNGPRLSLDVNWDIIAKERKTNPRPRATPKNLAYSIYTSVGLQETRGVRISHRGLLNYLSWGIEAFQVAKGSMPSLDSSIPFDLAITRALSLLMFGRSIYLGADSTALPEMKARAQYSVA
ncbi:MAG TPA: AMP-binding protein [Pyrinomonadaceae bacterium]|nr:AMP-binding protein [Pyrinomonadaceae bacterium]